LFGFKKIGVQYFLCEHIVERSHEVAFILQIGPIELYQTQEASALGSFWGWFMKEISDLSF